MGRSVLVIVWHLLNDPAARYRDAATGAVHHGAVLLSHGLPLDLAPEDNASALVRLVREG